ncbi:MAG TPA: hypothetical protein VHA80_13210 [Solirubrobacterales bacterium]|nr:hypothetical protein [Solirubrobacterales bacterium]
MGMTRSIHVGRGLVIALCTMLALAVAPAVAHALPGDPPVTPLGPANGATVPADEDGIHVTFLCLPYHSEEPTEDEEEEAEEKEEDEEGDEEEKEDSKLKLVVGGAAKPKSKTEDLAGSDSYIVRFSPSPTTGPDGLLTTTGFGADRGEGFADPEANKTTCGSDFELPAGPGPVAMYQGTVYWQVAREVFREGADTDQTEWETGPVQSFKVVPKVEDPSLDTQEHIYAGYLTAVEFSAGSDLAGATVELQRFTQGVWTPLAQEPGHSFDPTIFFVKLPASQTALRAVVKTPTASLPLEPKKVTVRKVAQRRATSAKDDGRYHAVPEEPLPGAPPKPTPSLHLEVVGGGTAVVHLRTSIEVGCPGPTEQSPESKVTVKTALGAARIAPDGTVVGRMLAKGPEPEYVTFVGQLFDRRLSGTLTTAFGPCTGTREIEAVKLPSPGRRSHPGGGSAP